MNRSVILAAAVLAGALIGCERATPPAASAKESTMPSAVQHFTEASFAASQAPGKPVLIDFWAAWCGPCRTQGPILEQVAAQVGDQAVVGKVNVDEERALASQFGVQSIPTLVVLKDGKEVQRFVGVTSAEVLVNALRSR